MKKPSQAAQGAPSSEMDTGTGLKAPKGIPEHDDELQHGLYIARKTLIRYGSFTFEDAEDNAQEIGLSFVMRRAAIRNPPAWFYYSAFRRATESRRSKRPQMLPLKESDLCDEVNEAEIDCQRKLLSLGHICRQLLGYLFIQEMTMRETAVLVERTLKEVFLLKQRCLKSLRSRLIGNTKGKTGS